MMDKKDIEDLMEEFNVKPMTKGLGFHHSLGSKKEVKSDLELHKKSLQHDLEKRSKSLKKRTETKPVHMGELAAFYETQDKKTIQELPELIAKEDIVKTYDAGIGRRFVAWSIDVVLLLVMLSATILGVLLFSEISLESFSAFIIADDLFISFGAMYFLFYLFYFAMLDRTEHSSFGKKLLGIRVDGAYGNIDYITTFARTSLSLFSVLTLGLFTLLSLHDSFTGTKVLLRDE
ncbi:MAG: hypothetical protein CME62_02850 [Halobacteriovoraceae bacterium]|nr:hypothetical protein [Halobacteriovoraceae bacterium]|tara:strand:- start:20845 stop:21543 length:699 start_codon:yes stop_codon:yes gene_type:complete